MLTEEFLLAAGKEYDRRKEVRRQLRQAEEVEELRDRPAISQYAQNMIRTGAEPIEDRLLQLWKRKQEASKTATKTPGTRQEEEQLAQMTFHPVISKYAATKPYRGDQGQITQDYLRQREKKIEAATRRARDTEGAVFTPRINASSRDIVASSDMTRSSMNVEDFLLMKEEQRRQKLHDKTEVAWENAVRSPTITKLARNLERPGDVSTRLYAEAEKRNQHIALQQEILLEEEQEQHFQPRINSFVSEKVENERIQPVFQRLTSMHAERMAKMSERQARESMLESTRHKPVIDNRSKEIARNRMDTTQERLMKPRAVSTPPPTRETFRPKLNQKSVELEESRMALAYGDTPLKKGESFEARMKQWELRENRKNKQVSDLRRVQNQEELRECTFDPRFYTATIGRSPVRARSESNADFAARCQMWARKKEDLLQRKRQIEDSKELEDCTFIPYVNHDVPRVPSSALDMYEGVQEHVQRQQRARQMENVRQKSKPRSHEWTGKPTRPVEFKFQHRERLSHPNGNGSETIRALRRPVQGPSPFVVAQSQYIPHHSYVSQGDQSGEDFLLSAHQRIVQNQGLYP